MASPSASNERAHAAWVVALLAAATVVYALTVIKDFSGPLVGEDDINALENLGFAMEQHGQLLPFPKLELLPRREVLYPFGTLVVFLPWGVERDLLYALLHPRFGEQPYLQVYQLVSVVLSAAGTVLVLRRDHGVLRAGLVAFAAVFMNFYAAYKYPHHMNITTMHWMGLGIVCDFVLVRRAVEGERWSGRLLLGKAAFLVATLGLDLGYVAGFAFTSTVLSAAFLVAWMWTRRRAGVGLATLMPEGGLVRSLRATPRSTLALGAVLVGALAVYAPIVAQIVLATRKFSLSGPGGAFWASQLRMLLPYLPGVGPTSAAVAHVFGTPEGVGEFSVGWGLLALGLLGARFALRERRALVLLPLAALFALSFAYHPRALPTLRIFPWFAFNRVAGRATLIYPLLFALAALMLPRWENLAKRTRAAVAAALVLCAAETATAYAAVRYEPFRPDASFWSYMRAVREAPGEAVLDWPFCIAGGNGVATEQLCPFYARTSTTYAYRRFHRKNVVGLLLSRMTPEQAQPFLDLGWDKLFAPDSKEIRTARRQTRCLSPSELELFERFYRAHDFAGVSLYVDMLPAGCPEVFYERFGAPIATTVLPAEGRAVFLPKARREPSAAP